MSKEEIEEVIKIYDAEIPTLQDGSKMKKQCIDLRNSLITFLDDKTVENPRPIGSDHRDSI
jgi:hypothetical protein